MMKTQATNIREVTNGTMSVKFRVDDNDSTRCILLEYTNPILSQVETAIMLRNFLPSLSQFGSYTSVQICIEPKIRLLNILTWAGGKTDDVRMLMFAKSYSAFRKVNSEMRNVPIIFIFDISITSSKSIPVIIKKNAGIKRNVVSKQNRKKSKKLKNMTTKKRISKDTHMNNFKIDMHTILTLVEEIMKEDDELLIALSIVAKKYARRRDASKNIIRAYMDHTHWDTGFDIYDMYNGYWIKFYKFRHQKRILRIGNYCYFASKLFSEIVFPIEHLPHLDKYHDLGVYIPRVPDPDDQYYYSSESEEETISRIDYAKLVRNIPHCISLRLCVDGRKISSDYIPKQCEKIEIISMNDDLSITIDSYNNFSNIKEFTTHGTLCRRAWTSDKLILSSSLVKFSGYITRDIIFPNTLNILKIGCWNKNHVLDLSNFNNLEEFAMWNSNVVPINLPQTLRKISLLLKKSMTDIKISHLTNIEELSMTVPTNFCPEIPANIKKVKLTIGINSHQYDYDSDDDSYSDVVRDDIYLNLNEVLPKELASVEKLDIFNNMKHKYLCTYDCSHLKNLKEYSTYSVISSHVFDGSSYLCHSFEGTNLKLNWDDSYYKDRIFFIKN